MPPGISGLLWYHEPAFGSIGKQGNAEERHEPIERYGVLSFARALYSLSSILLAALSIEATVDM